MDRLACSMVDLAQFVAELTDCGVRVAFVAERLTFDPGSDDPFATFQLHLLGAVAQIERSLVRARQRESTEIGEPRASTAAAPAGSLPSRSAKPSLWPGQGCAQGQDRPRPRLLSAGAL